MNSSTIISYLHTYIQTRTQIHTHTHKHTHTHTHESCTKNENKAVPFFCVVDA